MYTERRWPVNLRRTEATRWEWLAGEVAGFGCHSIGENIASQNGEGHVLDYQANLLPFPGCHAGWAGSEVFEKVTTGHVCQVLEGEILVSPEIARTCVTDRAPVAKMTSFVLASQLFVCKRLVNRCWKTIDGRQDLDTLGPIHHYVVSSWVSGTTYGCCDEISAPQIVGTNPWAIFASISGLSLYSEPRNG